LDAQVGACPTPATWKTQHRRLTGG
jgi:hypothetical protein